MAPLPTVSVIIPCYNGMPYVIDAIASVVGQADDGVEVVVVDDGSTDDCLRALQQTFGRQVRILRQANAGVAAARNRGLAETNGELVIWLDADDRLLPGTLSLRRATFVDDLDLEMLVGVNEFADLDTGSVKRTPRVCGPDYLVTCLLPGEEQPHLNAMTFRRSALWRIGGFDSRLEPCEDLDFWFRAWSYLRWRFLDTILAWHRLGSHSHLMGRTPMAKRFTRRTQAMARNRALACAAAGSDRPWRREYARWAATTALLWLEAGRRGQTVAWALRAIGTARGRAEALAYKLLLEGLLSPPVYRVAVRAVRWLLNCWPLGDVLQRQRCERFGEASLSAK